MRYTKWKKINDYRIAKRNKILGMGKAKICFDAIDKVVKDTKRHKF